MKTVIITLLVATSLSAQKPFPGGTGSGVAPNSLFMGLPLTGAKFATARVFPAAINDVDIYTAPTGKRALITTSGTLNTTGSSISCFFEIKTGGSYWRLTSTVVVTPGQTATAVVVGIVLESGESISINSTAAGINATVTAIEFDNSSPLRTVKVTGPASSPAVTTLYTVSTGKTGWILPATGTTWNADSALNYGAGATGTGNLYYCLIPSGQSVACANESTFNIAGTVASASSRLSHAQEGLTMASGDILCFIPTTGDAAQIAWVNVLEF